MLEDLVVDTDVLMHADNRESADRDASRTLIHTLRRGQTSLCFDEGFDVDPARNRSAILSEYFEHLAPGSLAFVLIFECATSRRVRTTSTRLSPEKNRAVNQLIWDRSDRKFIKVAINSAERVLVTHNTTHFDPAREELHRRFGVEITDAYTCCAKLAA